MDLAENLSKSFEYTKKLFSDFGRLVILIILDIIPIVNFVVIGYAAKVLKESPGSEAPPKLEKYGDLFVEGAKVFFASLIYMIVPLILIGAGVAPFIYAIVRRGGPESMRGLTPLDFMSGFTPRMLLVAGAGLVLVLLGALLAFVILIFLGAAIAHMVKTGLFGKAFAFGEVLDVVRKIGWGRYLGWIVLVAVISVVVGAIAGAIPFLGWLIRAIISPALTVFLFRSLGLLYSEGTR